MMRITLFALAALAAGVAQAATGSAAVDTWYVRPQSACTFNGDGLSYGCAASNGAAGAFRGLASLIWTVTVGIDDGDTLKVCGNFVAADKRNATTMLDVAPASGGAASDAVRITVDGNCAAQGGSAKATIDGSLTDGTYATSSTVLVSTGNPSYVTVKNIVARGDRPAAQSGGGANFTTGTGTGVILDGVEAYPNKLGMAISGTGTIIRNSIVDARNAETDAINMGLNAISVTIDGSQIYSNATGNSSDVIDCSCDNLTSLVVSNNKLWKGTGDKSTLTVKQCATCAVTVSGNEFHGQGDNSYGFRTESNFSGAVTMTRNWFERYGPTANLIQLDSATTSTPSLAMSGNVLMGGGYQLVINDKWTITAEENVFYGAKLAGVYSGGTAPAGPTSLTMRGNLLWGAVRHIQSFGYEDAATIDYNAYWGGGDLVLGNTTYATLAAAVAGTAFEDHGIATDPKTRSSAPTRPEHFRTMAGSPLRAAGLRSAPYVDYQGCRFETPPSIGAFETCGRDQAPARTRRP